MEMLDNYGITITDQKRDEVKDWCKKTIQFDENGKPKDLELREEQMFRDEEFIPIKILQLGLPKYSIPASRL